MNNSSFDSIFENLRYRLSLLARLIDPRRQTVSFASTTSANAIQRIYVINLDRKPDRWKRVNGELSRLRDRYGQPLSLMARRFSAVDARYMRSELNHTDVDPTYTLADQLLVEPNPMLSIDDKSRITQIEMSTQEIAVALSHIEVWKLIAQGQLQCALVLEDDVFFKYGFAGSMDRAWSALTNERSVERSFDLLYASYKEVRSGQDSTESSIKSVRRPQVGLWWASGYVLSKKGALRLLDRLPVCGPVDLWLNHQFETLDVFLTQRSIIGQRIDGQSSNSYSIMPILSQVGAFTEQTPLVAKLRNLPEPVIVYGCEDSGLTSIAMALSMLGYTCCSDLRDLPAQERLGLLQNRGRRQFNAYVNIGSLGGSEFEEIAKRLPRSVFINTTPGREQVTAVSPKRILSLPVDHPDKWAALTDFLRLEYPAFTFPVCDDVGQRALAGTGHVEDASTAKRRMKSDKSPWIISPTNWQGIRIRGAECPSSEPAVAILELRCGAAIGEQDWKCRDDTFPSNLALFQPTNVSHCPPSVTKLTIERSVTSVRAFASAAIATKRRFRFGSFSAELKPAQGSGLVTGLFLHRNAPHQEIDMEFLGKDPSKVLLNVFYNPGVDGTKLEYGYRGTPILIDLGFDASKEAHLFEIEWRSDVIRWRVDGRIIHERFQWDPTPIPNLPLELNVNLWPSRSRELAGLLDTERLPVSAEIRSIRVTQDVLDKTPDREGA